jgi:Ser/Thr protein kinase RdoA (MazF antagonist)
MANIGELALEQQLKDLQAVAEAAIGLYQLPPNATVVLVNLSENATYRVEDRASSQRWALRVHREGYHSKAGIASELAWLMALRDDGVVVTPRPVEGIDGHFVQTVWHRALERPRHVVLFEWETGIEPAENDALLFEILG